MKNQSASAANIADMASLAATRFDESNDVKAWILAAQSMSEVHCDLLPGVLVLDAANDGCNHLKVLASHVRSPVSGDN